LTTGMRMKRWQGMSRGWVLVLTVLSLPSLAETPFAGTWQVDPERTEFSSMLPLKITIERGVFKNDSCASPVEVPADGGDHGVPGNPYFDAMSVRLPDARTAEIEQKGGATVVWRGRYVAGPDSRSMTLHFEDRRPVHAVTGTIRFERVDEPDPAAHPLSGSWRASRLIDLSPSGRTLSFADIDNGLAMSASDGRSFSNVFGDRGGGTAPLHGYLDGAAVWVSRRAPHKLQINRSQDGTLVEFTIGTVSDDGRQLELGELDLLCQAKTTWLLRKQP